MPVVECKRRVPHSEYTRWMYWLEHDHLDMPDRTDLYLMQIAREVRCVLGGKGVVKHFYLRGSEVLDHIPGNVTEAGKSQVTKDYERAVFKSVWARRLGVNPRNY